MGSNGNPSAIKEDLENRIHGYNVEDRPYTSLAAAIVAGAHKIPGYVEILGKGFEDGISRQSLFTFEKKYLYRDDKGELKETAKVAVYRLARTMAEVEKRYGANPEQVDQYTEEFAKAMYDRRFVPAGRIWTNAGTEVRGLFNCYVLPVEDSLEGIFESAKNAAIIHKNGGGTGYNFSELRPRGTFVKKSKGVASGVVSFARVFDRETETINSGNRRGANMGILDVDHPDILDFIYAKRVTRQITNFNVSIGATDEFMKAAEADGYYTLKFRGKPFTKEELVTNIKNLNENKLGGSEVGEAPRPTPLILAENGIDVIDSFKKEVAGKINTKGEVQLSAKYVLNKVAEIAHKTGDPGIIFLDRINDFNPLPQLGPIKATNPCGEQPLHPYDACNLGSLNLKAVINYSSGKPEVDWNKLRQTVITATRFMDNVNDANYGPIPQVQETILRHRRIGLGVLGWADMLINLRIPYASEEAIKLAEDIMKFVTDESKKASVELAKSKGVFPAFTGSRYDTGKLEDRVRNVERTTIAPTGTISMITGVASGIEPIFSVIYKKNIRGGDSLEFLDPNFEEIAKKRGFYSEELIQKIKKNKGALTGIEEIPEDVRQLFPVANDIPHEWHVKMLAAFQKYTDNAVSKTINMHKDATIEEVKEAYKLAWKSGCKGITVYRDGSLDVQVLEASEEYELNPENLPVIRPSVTITQKTPMGKIYASIVVDPRKGKEKPYELFGLLGKGGEQGHADMEAFGRLASMSLRNGIPMEEIVKQLEGIGSGSTMPSRDGSVSSLPDGISRVLKRLPLLIKKGLEKFMSGKLDPYEVSAEIDKELKTGNGAKKTTETAIEETKPIDRHYKLICEECGSENVRKAEGCITCLDCQHSKC